MVMKIHFLIQDQFHVRSVAMPINPTSESEADFGSLGQTLFPVCLHLFSLSLILSPHTLSPHSMTRININAEECSTDLQLTDSACHTGYALKLFMLAVLAFIS